MLKSFRRITSSGNYLSQIDGLRFIAISSVVLFHLNAEITKKNTNIYVDTKLDYTKWNQLLENGDRGVPLFFAISGFILALPFAYHYITGAKKVELGEYFKRRVTRLEPPYILVMIVLFFASAFIVRKFNFSHLFTSLISSVFYTNNVLNIHGDYPSVNVVTWSLEIEVQFYILAPFIAHLYRVNPLGRRFLMISIIIIFPVIQQIIFMPFKSIFNYLQFFTVGLLLADLYVSNFKIDVPKNFSLVVGLMLITALYTLDISISTRENNQLLWSLLCPLLILGFFFIALFSNIWKKILSYNVVPVIGGMCYSIYLLHFAIISLLGKFVITRRFTRFYFIDWSIACTVICCSILIISSLFFLFIEKPCMNKDWPIKLRLNLVNCYKKLLSKEVK